MSVRTYLFIALGAIVALAVAFAAGRYTTPTKTVERVEYVERVREVRLTQIARVTDIKWKRVTVTTPDGTTTATEEAETHENENSSEVAKTDKDNKATTEKVTTAAKSQWTIFVTPGVTIPMAGNSFSAVRPTIGVQVNRRLLGPVWAGAWFQTFGAAGVSVGLEW